MSKIYNVLIIIMLSLLVISFNACSNDTPNIENNQISGDDNVNVKETTLDLNLRENTPDSLPDNLDFTGQTVRILHRSEDTDLWSSEIFVENEIGEIVNDTLYQRNKNVEDRLNVVIESMAIPGGWSVKDDFLNTVRNSIISGSDDFDLIAGYAYYLPLLAAEGLLYNLLDIAYLDTSAIWWNADSAKELTIDNKMYFITGDYSLALLRHAFVMYFNKQLIEDYNIENLYQTVLDDNWTIEKVMTITQNIYNDINGDGIADKGDFYGYATTTGNFVDAYWFAFDQPIIAKDSNNVPQLAYNTTKMVSIVETVYDYFYNSGDVYAISEYGSGGHDPQNDITDMFVENRTVFMPQYLMFTDKLRTMESDYGILPYPKWTAEQKDYYTTSQNGHTIFCVPTTCNITDVIGAVMEAMSAESYRIVTPVYFEVVLKEKYSRDDESSQMLDIIRSGIRFDFGYSNGISLDYISNIFRNLITSKSNNFASSYEQSAEKNQNLLEKLIEDYEKLS